MDFLGKKLFEKSVTNQASKKSKKEDLYQTIVDQSLLRTRQNIGKWRRALKLAEDVHNPTYEDIIETYSDVVLDTHLTSVMNTRKLAVMSKPFMITDDKGEEIEGLRPIFEAKWFRKCVDLALDSIFWGNTLIEFGDLDNFSFESVRAFDRRYADPLKNIVRNAPQVCIGESYLDDPYDRWYLSVGENNYFGLLLKASPFAIWKKDMLAFWSEYGEIFGMPIRVGKTDLRNRKTANNMEAMLRGMGSNAWAMLDTDDELELVMASQGAGSAEVHNSFIKMANSEISKLILGQTMTTEDGSSRSQAEVHENVAAMYQDSDKRFVEDFVNGQLIPFLREKHKFKIPDNAHFKYDEKESLSIRDQFEIDKVLLEHYNVPEDYITDRYGTPTEGAKTQQLGGAGVGKSIIDSTNDYYGVICGCDSVDDIVNQDIPEAPNPATVLSHETRILEGIHNQTIIGGILDEAFYLSTALYLQRSIFKGWGKFRSKIPLGSPELALVEDLIDNVYIFSAAKQHQQVVEMSAKVFGADGKVRPFNDFKKDAKVIFRQFNNQWLKTEYQLAVRQSESASKWRQIEADADIFPFLKYVTVGDARVRNEHKAIDGVIKPVNSPFWNKFLPPNGFNCRCIVQKLEGGIETDLKGRDVPVLDKPFRMNSGKDRYVFSPEHPNFKVEDRFKPLARDNFAMPLPERNTDRT